MRYLLVMVAVLLGLASLPAIAADSGAAREMEGCIGRMLALTKQPPDADSINAMRSVCEQISLATFRAKNEEATAAIYSAQLFQNSVMLWLVVTLTMAGVILAAIQLWASYRLAKAGQGLLADGGEATVEQGKLVVRSSVVGIIILAMSFAFFNVYVLYVYRISETGAKLPEPAPVSLPAGAQEVPR